MRTLKKTLALVLCLAMIAGLCCFGTSAAFEDAAEIKNTEAAEVMNAIGVLKGDGTNFNPNGILTRAEAAVMLAKLIGEGDVKATSTYKDMKGFEWAQNFAAVCEAKGFILGDGKGNFLPGTTLTGYQFGLMLCRALGYKPAQEGVESATYEIGTAALMKKVGLSDAIENFDGTAGLTRDNAAALLLKALETTMVEYKDAGTTITGGGFTITTGASAATAVANTTVDYKGRDIGTAAGEDNTMQLCEKYFPTLNKTAVTAAENGGLAGNYWFLNKDKVGAYNALTDTKVGTYATEAVSASFPGGTKYVDIAKALGIKNSAQTYTIENYTNGTLDSVQTGTKTGAWIYTNYAATTVPYGVSVDVVVTATGTIRLIANVYYMGIIGAADVTKDTNTDDVDDRAINVNRYTNGTDDGTNFTLTALNCASFEEIYAAASALVSPATLKYVIQPEGDATASATKMLSIAPAASVTGKVSAKTGSAYTINGTVYQLSVTAASLDMSGTGIYTVPAVYYLDAAGNILYKTATYSVPNYAFLENFEAYSKTSTGLADKAGYYMQAELVMLDGTVKIVDVASIEYVDGTVYNLTGINGTKVGDGTNSTVAYGTVNTNVQATELRAYTYTENEDGTYNLVIGDDMAATGLSAAVTNTAQYVTGNVADNTTTFVVRTGAGIPTDPYKYTAYTGYAALPAQGLTANAIFGNSTAKVVYITGTQAGVEGTANYVYITDATPEYTYVNGSTKDTYVFKAIVNGATTTVTANSSTQATLAAVGMYTVKYTDGVITTADAVLDTTFVGTVAKNGVIYIGGSAAANAKTYDDATVVYYVANGTVKVVNITELKAAADVLYVTYVKNALKQDTDMIAEIYAVPAEFTVVDDDESLIEAVAEAEEGDVIVLGADIELDEILYINEAITLNGNGHTITIDSAWWGIVTVGGTFKNLTIDGTCTYGILAYEEYADVVADVILENVTILDADRPVVLSQNEAVTGTADHKFIANNCTFAGKLSWDAIVITDATFTNCSFAANNKNEIEFRTDATFTNCDFESGYLLNLTENASEFDYEVKLIDCTVDGAGEVDEELDDSADYIF